MTPEQNIMTNAVSNICDYLDSVSFEKPVEEIYTMVSSIIEEANFKLRQKKLGVDFSD
jgi:hypothetical protein